MGAKAGDQAVLGRRKGQGAEEQTQGEDRHKGMKAGVHAGEDRGGERDGEARPKHLAKLKQDEAAKEQLFVEGGEQGCGAEGQAEAEGIAGAEARFNRVGDGLVAEGGAEDLDALSQK